MNDRPQFDRPWPPLTPSQRYHMEVHGYVIIESMFNQDECEALKSEMYRLRDELLACGDEAHP